MEGYTYQEEQKYEVLKTAAGNTATGGEFVGVGVGLGAGFGMAGEIRNQMGSAMNTKPGTKTCPQCGASADAAAKFCRECGSALAPAKKFCSECGTQCEGTAKFCSVCGNKF
jgi:membrane protease subunit (stomatin/prohibitin family)